MLRPNCPPGYRPAIDLSLQVDYRNEPRPDVVVLDESLSTTTPAPIEGALLVVEVVSPTSHFRDMHAKTQVFAAAGVANYWVLDPTFEGGVMLTEFRISGDGAYEIAASTNKVFTTDVPYPISIDVPALTALRDHLYRAAGRP